MHRFAIAFAAVMLLTLTACSSPRVRSVQHVAWQDDPTALGSIAVGILVEHRRYEREPEVIEEEVREIVYEIISSLPNVSAADEQAIEIIFTEPTLWHHKSEYELVRSAREANVNTLCLLTVHRYAGQLWIWLIPPGWAAQTFVNYRLRVLDVASGEIVADLRRSRTSGGYLSTVGRRTLPRDLRDDLGEVFAYQQERE
jgi:hypothetical protein